MKSLLPKSLLIAASMAVATSSAMAAFTFTNGDLILGFQATSGTGANQNVFFNLGAGTDYRDGANGVLGNISTTLSATYGADWYSRSDLYFGVVGNLNQNPTSGIGSRPEVDGDPSRTFYVSMPTVNVGGSIPIAAGSYPSASLGTAGSSVSGMENMIVNLNPNGDGAAVLDQSISPVEWANGWTTYNPTPGSAFSTFTGGIQQNFGKTTDTTTVDLQRILATNTGANPTGVVGGGTYVTSFSIGSDGTISAIPEPSSTLLLGAAGLALSLRRRRQTA